MLLLLLLAPISQVLVVFFFSKCPDNFLMKQSYHFCCFSSSPFHHKHGTFFNSKFHSYILPVFCYSLYKCLSYNFFIIGKYFISSICMKSFTFSNDFVNLKPPKQFLSIWLSSIISLTNNSGESEFTSARVCLPAVNSSFQFSLAFVMKIMTLSDILNICNYFIIHVCETILFGYFLVYPYHVYISRLFLPLWGCFGLYIISYLFLFFNCAIISVLLENSS